VLGSPRVRAGTLPLYLSLILALVMGVVPMRECRPTDGCAGGVVLLGAHGHDDHHDSCPGDAPGSADCVDSQMTLARPAAAVTLPDASPALVALVLPTAPAPLAEPATRDADVSPHTEVPPGVRSVVLLR